MIKGVCGWVSVTEEELVSRMTSGFSSLGAGQCALKGGDGRDRVVLPSAH